MIWAYDMSNEQLIDRLIKDSREIGGSRYATIPGIEYTATELGYFRGVLLARLNGDKPPFSRGDKVVSTLGHWNIERGEAVIVYRVWYGVYHNNQKPYWRLQFERGGDQFSAEDFHKHIAEEEHTNATVPT